MNKLTFRKRLRRLGLSLVEPAAARPPGPPRIPVPYPDGADPPTEREPEKLPPSERRIVIPDYDDRYPPGWFTE